MSVLTTRSVNVIMLGRMGFIPAFDIQTRYARQHLDEMSGHPNARGVDTLLLVEHTPVYTVGIRNRDYTQEDVSRLKATGAQFYTTNRGGLVTFHGPGQLVAYPILNLTRFKPSMKWYVKNLETTLVETLQQFGLTGRLTDQTGVWVDDRKIASIGLHGSRYVTTHGISLNCNNDLSWFKSIEPCGLKGVEMTSLSKELKKDVPFEDATKPFLRSFQQVFDCELEFKMLDKEDMKILSNANSPIAAKSSDDRSVSKTDKRLDVGVRLMSTLSSSSSSSSSSLSNSSSSPSSSSSSFPSPLFSHNSCIANDKKPQMLKPSIFRRVGPMW